MAQLFEYPSLDFGSGHDPRVMGSGSKLGMEPAWDSLSLPLSVPHPHSSTHLCSLSLSLSVSQKQNKTKRKNKSSTLLLRKGSLNSGPFLSLGNGLHSKGNLVSEEEQSGDVGISSVVEHSGQAGLCSG